MPRCTSIGSWTHLSAIVLQQYQPFFPLLALVPFLGSLFMKSFKGAISLAPPATATADRADCENASIPIPGGYQPMCWKLPLKVLPQCWVLCGSEENGLPWVHSQCNLCPEYLKVSFSNNSELVLTPLPIRTQNLSKMLNRYHPVPQHKHWFK